MPTSRANCAGLRVVAADLFGFTPSLKDSNMLSHLRTTIVTAGAFAAISIHATAAADVMFSGAGTWASDAAFTSLSAPDSAWSLSFVLPSVLASATTSSIASFSYRLAGVSLTTAPSAITFLGAADGGMFDIVFGSLSPSLSFYGDPVISGTSLVPGTYAVFAGISGGQSVGTGTLSISALPVPEPTTWGFLSLGLAGIAGIAVSRRTRSLRTTPVAPA